MMRSGLLGLALCAGLAAQEATPPQVKRAYLEWLPNFGKFNLNLVFAKPLASEMARGSVRSVVARPSGTILTVVSFVPDVVSPEIGLDPKRPPAAADNEFVLETGPLGFTDGTKVEGLRVVGEIVSEGTAHAFFEKMQKQYKNALARAKSPTEKNIFAGFNASTPTSGGTEGNAEIHLNQYVAPNLLVTGSLRKSSAAAADLKTVNLAATYRKAFSLLKRQDDAIQKALQSAQNDPSSREKREAVQTALDAAGKKILAGVVIDGAGKLEAEALNFNVTNAVFDVPVQVVSRVLRFPENRGFWRFRVIPAGLEAGANVRSENMKTHRDTIARYKAGLDFGIAYRPPERQQERSLIKQFNLDAEFVDRFLLNQETAFDTAKNASIGVTEGHKYYAQVDFKVFVMSTDQGRLGFRVSFVRGRLPPAFNDAKTFQYGVVFETSDDGAK